MARQMRKTNQHEHARLLYRGDATGNRLVDLVISHPQTQAVDDFRVLICYADTGGGHKSAADALRCAIEELAARQPGERKVEASVEIVVGETNFLNAFFVGLYNYLLRNHKNWMKYYIAFIETFKPDQSPIGYLFCKPFMKTLFARVKPSVVISVHPMANHYLYLGRRDAATIVLFDPNRRLTKVTAPAPFNYVTQYFYDANNNLIADIIKY
jgi:hypothetical protein